MSTSYVLFVPRASLILIHLKSSYRPTTCQSWRAIKNELRVLVCRTPFGPLCSSVIVMNLHSLHFCIFDCVIKRKHGGWSAVSNILFLKGERERERKKEIIPTCLYFWKLSAMYCCSRWYLECPRRSTSNAYNNKSETGTPSFWVYFVNSFYYPS